MKLYDFRNWDKSDRAIELTEIEPNELLFREELRKIQKGWTVVDVGARVGYYTIKAGLLVGSKGRIISIEPHPQIFRVLKINIELYKLNNVISVCKSVGNKVGVVRLFETTESGGTSTVPPSPLYSLDRDRIFRWLNFIKNRDLVKLIRARMCRMRVSPIYVPIETLDRIAYDEDVEQIDLVKIDVQGLELDVLKGSRNILERYKPKLLVEIHPPLARAHGWKPEELYKLLHNYGYTLTIQKRGVNPMVVAHFDKSR